MNPFDESLRRLFRAAAQARQDEPGPLPAGLESRVLAQWRSTIAEAETDWMGAFFQRGLIAAAAVMVLSVAINWPLENVPTANELTSINDVIQETVTP